MHPKLTTALWLLCCAALLSGCGETVTVTKVRTLRDQVPPPLRVCQPSPLVPRCETQRCVAAFMVRVAAAGEDCRATVQRVKEWSERPRPEDAPAAFQTRQAPGMQLTLDRFFRWLGSAAGTLPTELAMGPE